MSYFYIDPNKDSVPSAIGKGLLTGGTLAAGMYGLSELRDFLSNKLFKPNDFPDYVYFEDEEDEQEKQSSMNFPAKYMYGLAGVGGAYGTYKLLNALKDKYNRSAIKGDLRKLEDVIEDEIQGELLERAEKEDESNRGVYFAYEDDNNMPKMSSLNTKLEMKKMAADPTVRGFIDGYTVCFEKKAILGDAGKFLLYDVPFEYAPIAYGVGSGLGAIGGWHLGKHVFDPYYDMAESESAPLSADTELLYKFKRKKEEEEEDGEDK